MAGQEQALQVGTARPRRENVADTDRQWLVLTTVVFALTLGLCFLAYQVYRATAPHPEVTIFLRGVKRMAHRLIPGL